MRKIVTMICLITLSMLSYGAYLEKIPMQITQPNGEILNVFITGDEFYRRVHDSRGYSIVQRQDGWYVYAQYDVIQDELVPSQYIVTSQLQNGLPMEKNLGISREKYMAKRQAYYEPTGTNTSGAAKNPLANSLNKDSKTAQQMNNIIICIGFSDTQNFINSHSAVNGMFNTNAGNNMRDYFSEMSYGNIDIVSSFYPPANGNVLRFYQDSHPRSYYLGAQNQAQREHLLLKNAVDWVNANYPIDPSVNLDINNDGECDFISFVIYGPVGSWSDLLWPHKWALYTYNVQINGKRVYTYNFELEGSPDYFNVGTFCHEGYHVLGAPDLYHYSNGTNIYSVGQWDVMEITQNTKPQSMSAYMKYTYGGWVTDMITAQLNRTYEVFPFYTNDGSDPEKQVIIRVPSSTSNQYYAVEYRKKTGNNYDNQTGIPGQGPLIYRIDTRFEGNAEYNPSGGVFDEVYLFRPGSTPSGNTYTNGTLSQALFTGTRTAFNGTNTTPRAFTNNNQYDNTVNISNIAYDNSSDSYTFFYGTGTKFFEIADTDDVVLDCNANATETISINSNIKWKVTVTPASASSWIDMSKTSGLNVSTFTVKTITANDATAPRTAALNFTGNGTTISIDVIQQACNSGECNPPVNFAVNYTANCEAELTWEAPAKSPLIPEGTQILTHENAKGSHSKEQLLRGFTTASLNSNIAAEAVSFNSQSTLVEQPAENSATRNGAWLYWLNDMTDATVLGAGSNTIGYFISFMPADLTSYTGQYMTKIKIAPTTISEQYTQFSANPRVQVYFGETLAVDLEVSNYSFNYDNFIELPDPILITGTQEIRFGVVYATTQGYPQIAVQDASNYANGKTDLMLYEGAWYTADQLFSGSPHFTFYMAAYTHDPFTGNVCDITVEMNDGYGDGWHNSKIVFVDESGTEWDQITCNKAAQTAVVTLPQNTVINCQWVSAASSYDGEVSFTIKNSGGSVIYTCALGDFYTPPTGNFCTFTNSCSDFSEVSYNIYRDGALIAAGVQAQLYTDIGFDAQAGHTWSIATICPGTESQQVSVTKEACDITTYNITASAGTGGAISPHGAVPVIQGDNQTFTITPNAGYNIQQVLVDGVNNTAAVASGTYTFTNVTAAHTIAASFALKTYTVAVLANPTAGGNVTGGGTYNHGALATVAATANATYNFVNWTENGTVVSTSASYTFNVTANTILVANFTPNSYTVAVSANPTAGGSVTGGGTYNHGASATVAATANAAYNFVNWTENGTVVSTSASYTFNVIANTILVANFALKTYTVAVSANPTAGGSVTGGGTYNHGASATVAATANAAYNFVNWTENGNVVSESADYNLVIESNRTLTANFAVQQFTIIYNNPDNGTLEVTANGETLISGTVVDINTEIIITATAAEGYTLETLKLNGSDITNGSTHTVLASVEIECVFMWDVGIDENILNGVTVYGNQSNVYIVNQSNEALKKVQIIDVIGRVVYNTENIIPSIISLDNADGVYMVRLIAEDGRVQINKVFLNND